MKVNLLMGRFQPFTLGHMKCVDAAAKKGLKTVIAQVETKSSDKKHPFTDTDIELAMQDLIKTTPDIVDIIKVKNADIVKIGVLFSQHGYEIAGWTCGTDRIESYTKMSSKYADQAGLTDDFQMIEVKRGDEDISATKVRNAILADDKQTFEKLTPRCFHKYYHKFQTIIKNVYEHRMVCISDYLTEKLRNSIYNIIQEGGAAGHMAHPYDYDDFTLRDLKGLIRNLFSGKIEDVTEKIDGTNIVATMNPAGEVVFIRNKGDLNSAKGGMTIRDMAQKWADKPSVAKTFLTAGEIITKVFNVIGKEFFNPDENTRIAANCECVVSGKTNIIPYASDQVDFHDLFIYKYNGNEWVHEDTTKDGIDKLERACDGIDGAQLTPQILIKTTENSQKVLVDFIKELDKIFKDAGCKEMSTIEDWKKARYKKFAPKWTNGDDVLYNRWFNGIKTTNIRVLKQQYGEILGEYDKKEYKKLISQVMEPLDTFFGKLGNAIIKQCDGIINAGVESEVIQQLKSDIEDVVRDVRSNGSIELNDKLTYQLNRLARLGDEINPVEGIVFRHKGKLMKLTGSFSSCNAVLGSIRFSK